MVDSIDPTNNGDPWSLTADGISETLYNQDENGNLVSHLAESVVQNDALDWTLTLKSGMKFSDGSPVNAQAVADCINDIMANNEMATASCGVITATAQDDTTVKLATERETTVMESVLCEWTNVIYKKDSSGNYVFMGPYVVKSFNPGVSMELTPNPYYDDNASKRPNVKLMCFSDATAMQQAFESGEIDMAFTVTPDAATQLEGEGKNHNGYSSDLVDGDLDKMGTLPAGDERNELAKEIQEQVYKDLPVIYLVDPQWHIAVSDKLKDYEPYCGDYYVVNDQLGLTNS